MFTKSISTKNVVMSLAILFLLLTSFFTFGLHYNFMRSDVLSYWEQSFQWRAPFFDHPPFYSLTISLLRAITLNTIPPVLLMGSINLLSFCLCIVYLIQFLRISGANQLTAALGAFLFGLWPFVGLTYTVMPLADIPAILLTMAGLVFLIKSNYKIAGLLFGLALITHKGVWIVIGMITIVDFYVRGKIISRRNFAYLAIMILPLSILLIMAAIQHHSLFWLLQDSIRINTSAGGSYPILDGLFGTFAEGGLRGIVKGAIILFFFLLSIAALVLSLKLKYKNYLYASAIALAVLAMFLFSSAATIWGPVRYSRFLVIPLILGINSRAAGLKLERTSVVQVISLIIGLFISQLVYAWYTAIIFFG